MTATNGSAPTYAASTSATAVVVSGLNITVATNQASYTRGQAVTSTAGVSASGSPVPNASVTFTITRANGTVVKQTATTGATGTAVSKLQLKKNDPVGTYQVRVDTTVNGLSGNAATNFTVQ